MGADERMYNGCMTGADLGVKPLWKNATTLDPHQPDHGGTTRFGKTRVAGKIKITTHERFEMKNQNSKGGFSGATFSSQRSIH